MFRINDFKFNTEGLSDPALASGPILLFVLIKYRDQADYSGHPEEEPCSGRDAYLRYGELISAKSQTYNFKLIYRGYVKQVLVGLEDEHWDVLSLVEWASAAELKDYMESPEVVSNRYHFHAGVENYRAIITEKS